MCPFFPARLISTNSTRTRIGLKYSGSTGANGSVTHSWDDGTALDYINWATNEPNMVNGDECVAIREADGKWEAVGCQANDTSVCKF